MGPRPPPPAEEAPTEAREGSETAGFGAKTTGKQSGEGFMPRKSYNIGFTFSCCWLSLLLVMFVALLLLGLFCWAITIISTAISASPFHTAAAAAAAASAS